MDIEPSHGAESTETHERAIAYINGRLAYVVLGPDGKTQIMRLVYRIEGDTLITDQTGHPHEERSTFRIDGDLLSITFAGELTQFRRER